MNRKLTFYIVILCLVIGFIVFVDANKPKPVDWRPTYGLHEKKPFGLYIFNREVPKLFKGDVIKLNVTPYEYFNADYNYDKNEYKAKGTFMSIGHDVLDEQSAKELYYFAEHGNTVFLSMKNFPPQLIDTLQVRVGYEFTTVDSIPLYVGATKDKAKSYNFSEGVSLTYFDSITNPYAQVLGYHNIGNKQYANFIKIPVGHGSFLLHTQPAAFTNVHLLKGNHHEYAEEVISHIKDGNIYWFSGRKTGPSDSPLRYIMAQPGLKWAVYLGLIGIVIFMFFNAKRKQRIIPEIPPVRNTTVDFTKTIGNLYYQEGNHHTIIDKKIIYFLERIRNEYLIDTYSLDDEFIEKLHQKTGKSVEEIRELVRIIKVHRHKFESTEADVIEINKAIENIVL